ncbi:MAG TPA: polyprenyl synthetase family protein [Mycobacteriales bacterium]|jgi:geranylgeranyl diphosphate synthase type I|nr:polyprenyl synthetase family protein [Mycobacteriales bacterium]
MSRTGEFRERVDKALHDFLYDAMPPVTAIAEELTPLVSTTEAFLLDGGKRLRPAFCYWGHRAAGGPDSEPIVRAAASLELLQACALMHDDVIDRSDTRRGAPSVHRRFAALHRSEEWRGDPEGFGQAAAILLGDLALIWADTMLARSGFPPDAFQHALPIWDAMRIEVMCGQYLDVVEQARGGGSVERALRVARLKSAKYTIERPLHLGAVLAGGGEQLMSALSDYGLPLGEAFQLRDDVLGVFGDPEVTGKPAGDDLREGKRTALVALALDGANDAQTQQLRSRLGDPDLDDDGVTVLREVITATGALTKVEQLISERLDAALAALAAAPVDESARPALTELATAVSHRAG